MSSNKSEKKGWYPGKLIDEIKEKRRSREIDKATLAAAAAPPVVSAPDPSAAPVASAKVVEDDKAQVVASTDISGEAVLPQAIAEEATVAQPDAAAAVAPIAEPQAEAEAEAAAAAAAATAESAQEKAEGYPDQHEVKAAGAKSGWAPGKFVNKAREHKAAAREAKLPEGKVSTDDHDTERTADKNSAQLLDTHSTTAPASETSDEKDSWSRGKYINKLREKRAEGKAAAANTDDDELDSPQTETSDKDSSEERNWHLGKLVKEKREKRAKANVHNDEDDDEDTSEDGEHKSRLLTRLRDRFLASRKRTERTNTIAAPVCQVTVTIQDARHVQATRPFLEIGVQGTTSHSPVFSPDRGLDTPFSCSFSVSDITTDVYVYVMEEYSVRQHCVGQVVLPLVRYFTIKEALPPCSEWVEIFPLGPEGMYGKHRSGVEKVPGSAMPHVATPLGYLNLKVELHLATLPPKAYLQGDVFDLRDMQDDCDEDGDVKVEPRILKYNAARFKRALAAPPLLKLLTTFPGSLGLLVLGIALPLLLDPYNVPPLIAFAIITNGAMVRTQRSFSHVILWADQVGKSDKTALGKLRQLKGLFGGMQKGFGLVATALEKSSNLWSWADPQLTMVAVAVLLAVSFALSALLKLLPLRALVFLVSVAVTGGLFVKSIAPPTPQEAAEVPNNVKAQVSKFVQRVPDSLELEHRYICETAVARGAHFAATTKMTK